MGKVTCVPGMSYRGIVEAANRFVFTVAPSCISHPGPFPLLEFIDSTALERVTGFSLHIDQLPPGVEGRTDFKSKELILSEETYEGLSRCDGRSRFTTGHEVGHTVLHAVVMNDYIHDSSKAIMLNRSDVPIYKNPDWQAEVFSSALLMPRSAVVELLQQQLPLPCIASRLQVSIRALEVRIEKLAKF